MTGLDYIRLYRAPLFWDHSVTRCTGHRVVKCDCKFFYFHSMNKFCQSTTVLWRWLNKASGICGRHLVFCHVHSFALTKLICAGKIKEVTVKFDSSVHGKRLGKKNWTLSICLVIFFLHVQEHQSLLNLCISVLTCAQRLETNSESCDVFFNLWS